MCRLALFNGVAISEMGTDNLKKFLDMLEESNGGHGNGFALIKGGEVIQIDKAKDLSNREIIQCLNVYDKYEDIRIEREDDWLLYHTRIASKGSIKDSNCHPYWNKDKSFVLAMNGTESAFGALGKSRDITDTEVLYEIIESGMYKLEDLTELSPRFIGFNNGGVFATNPSGYGGLEYRIKEVDDSKSIIIASEFPDSFDDVKSLKKSFVWREGEELVEEPVKVVTYNKYGGGCYASYNYNKVTNKDEKLNKIEEELEVDVEGLRIILSDKDLKDIQDYITETLITGYLDVSDIYDIIRYRWGEDFVHDKKNYTLDMIDDKIFLSYDDKAPETAYSKEDIFFTCSI